MKIERYNVISDIKFMDGFTINAGSDVRRVMDSGIKDGCLNVVYESDLDIKRMLWIKSDNLELISSDEELINNQYYQTEIKDKNENWFD